MKNFITVVALIAVGLFGCIHQQETKTASIKKIKDRTVALVEPIDDGMRTYCTGVWVNDETFLTARHCVEGVAKFRALAPLSPEQRLLMEDLTLSDDDLKSTPINYTVENDDTGIGSAPKRTHPGVVVGLDHGKDLAVVRTQLNKTPAHVNANVVSIMPETGTDLHIVGHGRGLTWTYIHGTVSSVRESIPGSEIEGPFVQISAPVSGGMSGGGAFDYRGNLVGITSFTLNAPNVAFFIHPTTVRAFLTKHKVQFVSSS